MPRPTPCGCTGKEATLFPSVDGKQPEAAEGGDLCREKTQVPLNELVTRMRFNQARVNGGSKYDSLNMPFSVTRMETSQRQQTVERGSVKSPAKTWARKRQVRGERASARESADDLREQRRTRRRQRRCLERGRGKMEFVGSRPTSKREVGRGADLEL